MSARDDYPSLGTYARTGEDQWGASDEADEALDEVDRLRDYNLRLRAELARWGWGDFHYGGDQPQDPVIVALLAEYPDA